MDLAPPATPAALSAAPTLGTLMHALRKSWKIAVPASVGGAVVAAALTWLLVPAQYTTEAIFRIQARPAQSSLEDESNFASIQKSQVAILKSYEVLSEGIGKARLVELYGFQTSPPQVQKNLTTNFDLGPEMLRVNLSGPDPEVVAALLNGIAEVYPGKTNLLEEARVKQQIAQLEQRLAVDQDRGDANRVPTIAEQLRDKRAELLLAEKMPAWTTRTTSGPTRRRIARN